MLYRAVVIFSYMLVICLNFVQDLVIFILMINDRQ